jgi:7-cyano-7-deazaguanine reductase
MTKYPKLSQLGRPATLPQSPEKAVLETVPNPQPRALYLVRFTAPEFTTLCPVTGQPDFAHLVIDYAPRARLVESKSLKLYLGSFRNQADFHEACTLAIGMRLAKVLAPRWLRIAPTDTQAPAAARDPGRAARCDSRRSAQARL